MSKRSNDSKFQCDSSFEPPAGSYSSTLHLGRDRSSEGVPARDPHCEAGLDDRKSVGKLGDRYPAATHDLPSMHRADPPSRIENTPSSNSPELRAPQLNDRQPEVEPRRPLACPHGITSIMDRPVDKDLSPTSSKVQLTRQDSSTFASSSVCGYASPSKLSESSDGILGRDESQTAHSETVPLDMDGTAEPDNLLCKPGAIPNRGSHIIPDHMSVAESPRRRRSIATHSKSRRSMGDEKTSIGTPTAGRGDASESFKVSKLDLLRRLSSRKSPTDRAPDIVKTVTTASDDAVPVPKSQDLEKPDSGSNKKASQESNAVEAFPLEILYPSSKHKTYGKLENGYTVWCSYGNERPTRYSSWVPPAKLFDTTYKSKTEANDRAKYLFFWENPLKVDPDELEKRCDVLAETVKKNCKSYDCKVNGATETWKVGVVPSAVFEWLDRAETRRHDFDEAFGSECPIAAAFAVD